MSKKIEGMKTWSGLSKNKRRPSEYEIVTTNLQTRTRHPDQAYELSPAPLLKMNSWYQQYVSECPLQHANWEDYRDPDKLIYRDYTRLQDGQEEYIDGLLNEQDEMGHDHKLEPQWLDVMERLYTPRRYLQSALQMGAAYIVQIAPASTITAAASFQEGDEFRWLSRIAYRTYELQKAHPKRGFGQKERAVWEDDPAWQGIRELFEMALATYDWGENFVAMNLVAKPIADETHRQLGQLAIEFDDMFLSLLIENQMRDSERSRRWSSALVEFALINEGNRSVLCDWLKKWMVLGRQAAVQYCKALPSHKGQTNDEMSANVISVVENYHSQMGLVK